MGDGLTYNQAMDRMVKYMNRVGALEKDLETERLRLAACGVAAMDNVEKKPSDRIGKDNPYYSASYGDVCRMVDGEISLRAELDRTKAELAEAIRSGDDARMGIGLSEELRDKLKADHAKALKLAEAWGVESIKEKCKHPADLTESDSDIGYRDALDSVFIFIDKRAAALRREAGEGE